MSTRVLAALFAAVLCGAAAAPLHGKDRAALLFSKGDAAAGAFFGEVAERLGIRVDDLAVDRGGKGWSLDRFDLLLVGPFAASDRSVSDLIRREAQALRDFVGRGGTVVVFRQDPDFWDVEPWLPPGPFVLRDSRSPGRPAEIERDHPLFSVPNRLDPARLASDLAAGGKGGGRVRRARGFHVVARDASGAPWCLEAGWGKGRLVILAWAPLVETGVGEGGPPGKNRGGNKKKVVTVQPLALRLVENLLSYALAAARGEAPVLPEEAVAPDFGAKARLAPAFFTAKADRAFAARVNEAVDRGIAWLKARQKEDGSWGPFGASNGTYRAGPTAIALLALLVSGVNKYDTCVARGFDWLLKTTPGMTYEIALAMMALEQKAAPLHERFELARLPPKERKGFRFVRNLDDRETRFMESCRDRILAHHVRGGAWRYRADLGSGDISNGQYAVLGLKAAARCGLAVDPKVWKEVLDYYLSSQEREGPKTPLPRFNGFDRNGSPRFYVERAEARGWRYVFGRPSRPGEVLGTHVCIGVACTILACEELESHGRGGGYAGKVHKAVKDGLAWLYRNWSVDHRPGGDKFYYYYYIYSLERVGVLAGSRFIGDHDWYREGASYLLEKQNDDGSWSSRSGEWGTPVADTSFALLFLKRSTPPPVTTVGR